MKLAFRIGLSIALIVLLFTYVVDAGQFVRILADFQPGWLIAAFLVFTIDRVLMTYKWTVLLKAQGYRLPLLQAVMVYCTSQVWGLALPATVGADAIRAVMVTRRGFNGADVVSSIVVERIVGFALALALGVVSLFILRAIGILDAQYDKALYAGVAVLAGTLGLLIASMNEAFIGRIVARLPKAVRESKPMHYLSQFTRAYHCLGSDHGAIGRFAGLTVIEQLLSVVFPWTLAMGLGVPVDLLLLLGVMPLTTLVSRLPISFDGLGLFEAAFIGLMMLAGISAESSLAIAVSGRVIQFLAFLPWWFAHTARSGALGPPSSVSPRA